MSTITTPPATTSTASPTRAAGVEGLGEAVSGTPSATASPDTLPFHLTPQVSEQTGPYVEVTLTPEHATTLARQLIAAGNPKAFARLAAASAHQPSEAAVAVAAAMLTHLVVEVHGEAMLDLADALAAAHTDAADLAAGRVA